ncbi:MAG TPA: hypothetical protein VEP48_05420 [Methylomirabilota bacterium]|nr:hypothetical protein [Methylomirabilota bacterium]
MDALTDERGQALIVAVLFLAIAAVVIGGLRLAQEQILAAARERRAGEAAVEAAAAVAADAYVAGTLASDETRESARVAATDLSMRNGGPRIDEVAIHCARSGVEVALAVAGRQYRAGFAAAECSLR